MSHEANSLKAILFALVANFAISCAKYAAAFVTNSGSMLAEAVHSTADCGNQLLLLIGMHRAKKPPSPEYPLGYGKETYFWSFIVALMLFSVGGMFSVYEGWHKLESPTLITYPIIALSVLAFGILAESVSMWGCVREINKVRHNQSFWQWFHSSRNAELVVIFGEDFAALVGLMVAFIAILIAWLTDQPFYDALGSIFIGILLLIVAVFIGVKVKAMLIGQGVDKKTKKEMIDFLESQIDVTKVYNLVSMQMGKDIMVAVKVKMVKAQTGTELITSINKLEKLFRKQFSDVAFLFFEPDLAN